MSQKRTPARLAYSITAVGLVVFVVLMILRLCSVVSWSWGWIIAQLIFTMILGAMVGRRDDQLIMLEQKVDALRADQEEILDRLDVLLGRPRRTDIIKH